MTLDAALARVAKERPNEPIAMEFQKCLAAMRGGTPDDEAFRLMASNTMSQPLASTASAMAASLADGGGGLTSTLKAQADLQRDLRQSAAQEWAKKIPIKLLGPLVLCIFPSLFVPMLGPAGISIYETLIVGP